MFCCKFNSTSIAFEQLWITYFNFPLQDHACKEEDYPARLKFCQEVLALIEEHGQDAVLDSLVVTDQSSIHVFSGSTIHTEVIKITADFQYLDMPIPRLLFIKKTSISGASFIHELIQYAYSDSVYQKKFYHNHYI